ncbi:MAG: SDR family oxidoreductase [Actinomycetota bacterium]|nr:SDR family oxidoreductase [Actinomycetota bacterium]
MLITGGFGYLGSRLAQYYREQGQQVRILSRRRPAYLDDWAKDFDVRLADVKDSQSLVGCCDGVDVVVHTAAADEILSAENELEALLVNGYGTKNMADEAARAHVGHFVYFSTFHAYGPVEGTITEDILPRPAHSYGLTHLVGEYYLSMVSRRSDLTATALRISNGYGAPVSAGIPRWTLVINDFCRAAHAEGRIVINSSGRQHRDFVAIADICQAVNLVAPRRNGAFEVYNLGGADSRSILDIAHVVQGVYAKRYGAQIDVIVKGADEGRLNPVDYSIEKLKSLGYRPEDRLAGEVNKIFELLERTA